MKKKFKDLKVGEFFKHNTYTWRKKNYKYVKKLLSDDDHNAVIVEAEDFRALGWSAYFAPDKEVEVINEMKDK